MGGCHRAYDGSTSSPAFYLNGFADNGRIWRVTLPGEQQRVCSTKDVSVQRDFYNVTLSDGSTTDAFEHLFADIEDTVAPAFRRLTSSPPMWPAPREDRVAIATWVALQALRGDRARAQLKELDAEMIKLVVGASGKQALRSVIERAEGQPISDEDLQAEWDDITKPGGPDLAPDPDKHLRMLMSLWPEVTQNFGERQWTLWTFQRKRLATSDHPVSLLPSLGHPAGRGIGLFNAGGIAVSLNRFLGLTMTLGSGPDLAIDGTTVIARDLNGGTVRSARRYVYHHPDDEPLSGLELPAPRAMEIQPSGSDFVAEDGLFAHVEHDRDQVAAFERMSAADPDRDDDGLTIDDLTWPIPGRRSNVVRHPPGAQRE